MSHATLLRKSHANVVRRQSAEGSSGNGSASTPAPATSTHSTGGVVSTFSLTGVQRKVKVGEPGDAAEHEANRVADQVASGSSAAKPVIQRLQRMQRKPSEAEPVAQRKEEDAAQVNRSTLEGGEGAVQRAQIQPAKNAAEGNCTEHYERPSGTASIYCKLIEAPSSAIDNELNHSVRRMPAPDSKTPAQLDAAAARAVSNKDAGMPLRPPVQQKLESRMGADLGGVRVHEGPAAHESAAALNARAFTHQGDIFLGKGESQDNLNLMAHEATHVVQQGAAAAPAPAAAAAPAGAVPAATPASAPAAAADSPVPAAATPAAADASAPAAVTASGDAAAPAAPAKAGGKPAAAPGEKAKAGAGGAGAEPAAAGGPPAEGAKKSKPSPDSDPAFQAVVTKVKGTAAGQKAHAPVSQKVAAAHGAVESSSNEVPSRAAAKQTDVIDQQKPKPFDRASFKAALLKKIEKTAPKSLKEADDFKSDHPLDAIKPDLTAQVKDEKKESQGPVAEKVEAKPDPTGIEPKPAVPLPAAERGAPPQVAAAGAAPKPASEEDISLQAGPKEVNQQMASADVTEEQLKDSNEPAFQDALSQKKDVEKESVAAPKAFRAEEPKFLKAAQNDAQSVSTKDVQAMHGGRVKSLGGVTGKQTDAKAEEEKRRAKIFADIQGIYDTTKTNVEKRLQDLDKEVNDAFDSGSAEAQQAFENYVDARMTAYKDDRYDGAIGAAKWAKDKLFGLPDEVNRFYQEGHDLYIDKMDKVIDHVSVLVETGLNEAKDMVSAGKAAIHTYLDGLPQAEKETGQKAADGIQSQFEALDQTIVDKQGELIDSLAKKYNDNLQKVNARIDEMKQANQGLVDKVVGAIKGVIETIRQLKNMLLNVLSRAVAAIGMIIAHPIKFLGHLVDAGMKGFNQFKDHILEHLKEGFMQWLFGAVAAIGIQLPKSFDLAGILSLVLQVLGLTYANIRARAVNILGEKIVVALETTAEIFKVLITKGPGGLWEYIKDQLGNLIETVIDSIKSFIMEKVIIAGITWLIGLLNPASAFVKACKAIYDIVMFFVERGSQILDLVNTIIDSITAIADGKIDQAANWIEKSLARAIPVIIGFLASLLGVGGISEKIKEVIDKIRKPINSVIDWVINKAAATVKAIGGALGFGKDKEKAEDKPEAADGGAYIYEEPDTGGHVLRIRSDLQVFRFSNTPTPVSGKAAQKVEQDALEKVVPRIEPKYPQDSLDRAAGASGHATKLKDGDGREAMLAHSQLAGGIATYQPGDHRGHLIGDRFGGAAHPGNLVPMHPNLNLSTFKTFENSCASEYKSLKDASHAVLLYMRVVPSYPGKDKADPASYRPTSVYAEAKTITLKPGGRPAPLEKAVPGGGSFTNPDSGFVRPEPVNLSSASQSEIATVSGIGPTLAQNIVKERRRGGPFWEYADLQKRVEGIGGAIFEKLQNDPLVRIR